MTHWHLTETLALGVSTASSEAELHSALARSARTLGFDHFALAYDRRGRAGPGSMLLHDYPEAWARVYVGFELGDADPVRRAGERSMTGFLWRDLALHVPLTRGDRQMLAVGRENGLADGYTVPRHLPGEASGTCSFVARKDCAVSPQVLHVAELVGAFALTRARAFVGPAPMEARVMLSERQRECVLWTARGKTAGEAGAILGISEETVVQHLKNARERYAVHCRQMLILCALFDGLIGFSDVFDWWHGRE